MLSLKRIYLVDDDESVLRTLGRLLTLEGYDVVSFDSPSKFLFELPLRGSGCVIADLRMPEMDGIELYDAMRKAGSTLPVIFLTGHGAVSESVRAMKRGAVNFLTKPAERADVLAALHEAFALQEARQAEDAENLEFRQRFATLTPREEEVCLKVVQGLLNKQIAGDLGTTEKTIKVHRSRVMEKMRAASVAELVRIVDRARPLVRE